MKFNYHRENFDNPIVDSNCTAELLIEMFWACSTENKLKLYEFLAGKQQSVEFTFTDGDKVTISRK